MNNTAVELAEMIVTWEKYDDFVKEHGWGAPYKNDDGTDSLIDDLWDSARSKMVALAHNLTGRRD